MTDDSLESAIALTERQRLALTAALDQLDGAITELEQLADTMTKGSP